MNANRYLDLIVGRERTVFDFVSTGPRGNIRKRVAFLATPDNDIFQLAFGDYDPESGHLDDRTITNNADRDKVLATIVEAVNIYTRTYPQRWVYFEGSSNSRTRLYRIAIAHDLHQLSTVFDIQGILGHWSIEPFQKNRPYQAFLIKRKTTNFKL